MWAFGQDVCEDPVGAGAEVGAEVRIGVGDVGGSAKRLPCQHNSRAIPRSHVERLGAGLQRRLSG